jgi:hypothetical protein
MEEAPGARRGPRPVKVVGLAAASGSQPRDVVVATRLHSEQSGGTGVCEVLSWAWVSTSNTNFVCGLPSSVGGS